MNKHPKTSHLKKWQPGQSGNPLGRPLGARAKFSETAMANLLEDWTTHGPGVLATVRKKDPSTYLRVAFGTIPKDVQIAIEQRTDPMDSNEMRAMRRLVEIIQSCAATNDPETVFAWIEEDLRARVATQISS